MSAILRPTPPREPSYIGLAKSGELAYRASVAMRHLEACNLCGWRCDINRFQELGPCRTGTEVLVSTSYVHMGEEKPLVGKSGSGAIFFANCDLRCQFCQTFRWNIKGIGTPVTTTQLANLMITLQQQGAININLVTPTHVLPQVLSALVKSVDGGLNIPLVWNSGGYDTFTALELLDGVVDIYLPDMKYSDSVLAMRLSGIKDYPEVNQAAVKLMHDQVGDLVVNDEGVATNGVIIRHLVMPGLVENTLGVLNWIANTLGPDTYLSLMDQYRPAFRAVHRRDINRPITADEFSQARAAAKSLGLHRLDESMTLDASAA